MFNTESFFASPFELTLAIDEAAIDFGYAHEEAKTPESVPYHCELSAYYTPRRIHPDNAVISTRGLIYPTFKDGQFTGWDLTSFEPDDIANSDYYGTNITQDNEQGYAYDCTSGNLNSSHAQMAANTLDRIIRALPRRNVTIEYPNGFVNLVTPENYPSEEN